MIKWLTNKNVLGCYTCYNIASRLQVWVLNPRWFWRNSPSTFLHSVWPIIIQLRSAFHKAFSFNLIFPLQAWRGYHGNVYFEPIEVKSAILDGDTLEGQLTNASAICRLASRNQPLPEPTTSDLPSLVPERGRSKAPASRPIPRSGSSPSSSLGGHGPRPMAVLDKRQVLRSHNEHLREDLQWIHGQESTGSLCISPDSEARRRALLSKERICKGSMAHRVFMQRQAICSSSAPQLRPGPEHGGFNRRVLNSPQLKGTDKLPPLAPIGSVWFKINIVAVLRIYFPLTSDITRRLDGISITAQLILRYYPSPYPDRNWLSLGYFHISQLILIITVILWHF